MKNKYAHIFEPLTVRAMTVKNRICMMPMGTNYGEQNGEMSFLHIDYYRQRAKGGTGLLIVENANVDFPQGSNGTTQLRIDHDNYLPRLYKFCEDMHRYGAKLSIQINHAGASAMSSRIGGLQPVSSSNIPSKTGGAVPRPLSKDEILAIVKKYGEAAKRAQTAGFDAVEIHAGHSYLISQFLSPVYNDRTDEFGGSIENRTRFCRMIIDEVRSQIGPHMPIMLRLSADELVDGGNTLEDTLKYLEYLNDEVDIFDVSCGLNDSIQYQIDANYMKDGWRSYMAKAVKEKFGKPVISMGNYRDPQVVEDTLARGDCDLIGMGRGLIAEPNWVHKVANDQECMLRKCISCNIGCAGNRIGGNRPIRCTVNPSVLEGDTHLGRKVNKNCNVVVIGGGNVAIDVARDSKRCASDDTKVNMFCLESRETMPASVEEIEEAESEGIVVNPGWGPKEVLVDENGEVRGVVLKKCLSVFDAEGRFNPTYDESELMTVECKHVFFSVGQSIVWGDLLKGSKVELGRGNGAVADELTYQTAEPDIFVGGDVYTGPKFAIDAIAAGKQGAISIHRFVQPQSSLTIGRNRNDFIELDKNDIKVENYDNSSRQIPGHNDAIDTKHSFRDAKLLFTEEQVKAETARCLGCGASVVDPNKCIGCGLCTTKCEFDAIKLHRELPECSRMVPYEDRLKFVLPNMVKQSIKLKFKKK